MRPSMAARSLHKEVRALLPTFVACALALLLSALTRVVPPHLTLLLFCGGAIALGAQSFGHEYGHRTLGLLLSQPSDRRRVFFLKMAVLCVMVFALTLLAAAVMLLDRGGVGVGPDAGTRDEQVLLVLAALPAVCVAPWLSMLCRGILPGLVFTVAIPGLLLLAGEVAGTVKYGFRSPAMVADFRLFVLWWAMSAVCVVGAISSWRTFMRLEAIEGHADIQMPRWWRARSEPIESVPRVPVQNPGWLLVRKELRLQQMTFAVVGLYVLAWTVMTLLERLAPEFPRLPLLPMTFLYASLLAILIGSLASAEERHLGTLPWQTLLPMAAWKQWMVKAATTIGLAVLFGIALPVLLTYLFPTEDNWLPPRLRREPVVAIVVLTSASLYVSSLCTSGVRALTMSLPVVVATFVYATVIGGIVWSASFRLFYRAYEATAGNGPAARVRWVRIFQAVEPTSQILLCVAGLAIAVVLLRFAFVNHRTTERSARRVVLHAAILLLLLTISVVMPVAVWAFYFPR